MKAQSAGADNVESESASEQDEGVVTQTSPLLASVMKAAASMGHTIDDDDLTERAEAAQPSTDDVGLDDYDETHDDKSGKADESVRSESESKSEESSEGEVTEIAVDKDKKDEKAEQTEGPKTADGKEVSIDDQLKDYAKRGEKAPWYLHRIAEETQKKNDRTAERNAALTEAKRVADENKELRQALDTPPPVIAGNGQNPLANCWSRTDFEQMAKECRRAIVWAEKNREYGGTFVFGKDQNGKEDVKELTGEQAIGLKLAAEDVLREMPKREQEVAKFYRQRSEADREAESTYPWLKDPKSDEFQELQKLLRDSPMLQLIPDIKQWLARAFRGRAIELAEKNGKVRTSDKIVRSIEESQRSAPVTPNTRGVITPRGKNADLAAATKQMEEKGDKQAAEKFVSTLLAQSRAAARNLARVE